MLDKILIVRKMSALEYYYNGNHPSQVINESHNNHTKNIELIASGLREAGRNFDIVTRRELTEELISQYDAVISAGGDGTVIAVAAKNKNTPQLNLRTDERSAGALCQSDISSALSALIAGDYKIEKWTRLDVSLNVKFIGRALNQVAIGEQLEIDKMAKYKLEWTSECGALYSVYHRNSGLVIATGTGSTGWKAEFKAYGRDSKLLRFSGISNTPERKYGEGTYFMITYLGHEGKFRLDSASNIKQDLPRDSILEIQVSKFPLKVVTPNEISRMP